LVSVVYSQDPQSTPSTTYTYDRRGRRATAVRNSITTTFAYNDADDMFSESYSGGTLGGLALTNVFDTLLRRTTNNVWNGATRLAQAIYTYDAASRLQTASDGTNNATYAYVTDSPLVGQITFKSNAVVRLTTMKAHDYLDRLHSIESSVGSAVVAAFAFQHNDVNQRVRSVLADGSFWIYEYDTIGQVTSGKRYWADGTPVAGQQFQYAHDDIGNRTSTKAGGDENGANLRSATYSPNLLNRYTNRSVPGEVDIIGIANATASVTLNSQSTYRRGEYYRKELSVNNAAAPQWQGVTNQAVEATTTNKVIGNVYVPKTPEAFVYDDDGNLLSDGRWIYTWDAENRLVVAVVNTGVGTQQYLELEYDHQGRRIGKKIWNNTTGTGQPATALKYLYDRWNLVALLNGLTLQQSFLWGLDLSGSEQGAGGVGGLLKVTHVGAQTTNCFVAFDGNGNVAGLVNASSGSMDAQYEYGPFGEVIRATGPLAKANPFRFSTKYQDDETDLLYYGYRYYNASTGRWLSRDPIEEGGGENLYTFVRNAPIILIDLLGLRDITASEEALLRKLEEFARKSGQKDPEFEKAMSAVIKDIRGLIGSVKGETDPATLRIGLSSLKVWANPQQSKLYSSKLQGTVTCNKYVADVVAKEGFKVRRFVFGLDRGIPGTGNWHDPKQVNNFKVVWTVAGVKGRKTQIEWDQPLKGKGSRQPAFGDVISYPGHVGIFLGRKIYISSTTYNPFEGAQSDDIPIHFINESEDQLYRSPQ